MAYKPSQSYMFGYRAVDDKVPGASGVYAIFAARRWVYVGESSDIRTSLFRHLNNKDTGMTRFGALSFSFELLPSADRVARKQALVAELKPACN
jgi:hypothetical protein